MERNCDECGKPYQALKKSSKYCGSTCRAIASVKRKITLGSATNDTEKENPITKRDPVQVPPNTDFAAQFVINQQAKEIDRFERLYNDERTAKKDLRKKYEELKDLLAKNEFEQKLAAAATPTKGTLEGLLEHPMAGQLLQHIGPAIGELSMNMVKKATAAKEAVPQALGGANEDTVWGHFTEWLGQQPEDVQRYVGELMNAFTQIQGVEVLQKLYQVRELIMGQYMRATG
jgi:hypothetical protein